MDKYLQDSVWREPVVFSISAQNGRPSSICTNFQDKQFSGQTKVKKVLAFRDKPPYGGSSAMPCGACREFLLELNAENKDAEFMMDYNIRKTVKVAELIPYWWGEERASKFNER